MYSVCHKCTIKYFFIKYVLVQAFVTEFEVHCSLMNSKPGCSEALVLSNSSQCSDRISLVMSFKKKLLHSSKIKPNVSPFYIFFSRSITTAVAKAVKTTCSPGCIREAGLCKKILVGLGRSMKCVYPGCGEKGIVGYKDSQVHSSKCTGWREFFRVEMVT